MRCSSCRLEMMVASRLFEIVRDATGELADGFHLLALPELVLDPALLGDIAPGGIEALLETAGPPRR